MASPSLQKCITASQPARITLFGCQIDNLSAAEAVDRVDTLITGGGNHYYFAVNVHKVVAFRSSPQLCDIANRSGLVTADGQPIVWVSRWLNKPIKERVTGADLMGHLIELAVKKQYRVYFLGGQGEIVQRAVAFYRSKFPQLQIAGYRHGYWSDEEEASVVAGIREARPHILFLGMSSPRKELFTNRRLDELQVRFVMGVGGTFDIAAGLTRRAPRWVQRLGFEWLWRVGQEPRRMWKRYLFDGIQFSQIATRELLFSRPKANASGTHEQ